MLHFLVGELVTEDDGGVSSCVIPANDTDGASGCAGELMWLARGARRDGRDDIQRGRRMTGRGEESWKGALLISCGVVLWGRVFRVCLCYANADA